MWGMRADDICEHVGCCAGFVISEMLMVLKHKTVCVLVRWGGVGRKSVPEICWRCHISMTQWHIHMWRRQIDTVSVDRGRQELKRTAYMGTCMGCKFIQNSVTQMNIHIYSDTDIDTVKQMDNSTYLIFRHTKWTDVLKYIFPLLDVHPSILVHFIAIYLSIQTGHTRQ